MPTRQGARVCVCAQVCVSVRVRWVVFVEDKKPITFKMAVSSFFLFYLVPTSVQLGPSLLHGSNTRPSGSGFEAMSLGSR